MSLQLMDTFVRIVETRSLSGAAMQLGTSQPTVSRRLQALEQQLGVRLLQRSTHSLQLTEDGERCFARAKDLLANWTAFEAELRSTQQEPVGRLRMVTSHVLDQGGILAILGDFLKENPCMSVDWLFRDDMRDYVAEGIDCALQVGIPTDVTLAAMKISEMPRIAVAASSLLGDRVPVHPAELAKLPWVVLDEAHSDELMFSEIHTRENFNLHVDPRLRTDSHSAIRDAAMRGLGVCIGSTSLLANDVAKGHLIEVVPNWKVAPLPVYLTYPRAQFRSSKLLRFISCMRDVA